MPVASLWRSLGHIQFCLEDVSDNDTLALALGDEFMRKSGNLHQPDQLQWLKSPENSRLSKDVRYLVETEQYWPDEARSSQLF